MYIVESTKKSYQDALNRFHKIHRTSFYDLSEKDPAELSELIDSIVDKMEISDRSKSTNLAALRSIAQEEFKIALPKSKLSKLLRKQKLRQSNKDLLSYDEVKSIITYFEHLVKIDKDPVNLRNLILVKLLAGTTQRVSDILRIFVSDAISDKIHFKQEKTGMEVYVDNPCLPEIFAYKNLMALGSSDYLFASGLKRLPLDYTTAYRIIKLHAGKILPADRNITPHCFRKYGAMQLTAKGLTVNEVRAVTGHASTAMIDYYVGESKSINGTKNMLLGE